MGLGGSGLADLGAPKMKYSSADFGVTMFEPRSSETLVWETRLAVLGVTRSS
jgi:hypothetical protein